MALLGFTLPPDSGEKLTLGKLDIFVKINLRLHCNLKQGVPTIKAHAKKYNFGIYSECGYIINIKREDIFKD